MRHPSRRIGGILAAGLISVVLVLAGCSSPDSGEGSTPTVDTAETVMGDHGLAGLDARQTIDHLDAMAVDERPDTLLASVRPHELVLTDTQTGEEAALPVAGEQFYLAVAPYEQRTHNCYFHSLTTCLGEQSGETMKVTVTDDASGETIIDETRTTFDNGFFGLWLPRDMRGTLTVEHDGATGTTPISTGDDDLTCLTSLQLS